MPTDEENEVTLAAATEAWRRWHGKHQEDEIPNMSLAYWRGFMDALKWLNSQSK